jgi:toxin YoeB
VKLVFSEKAWEDYLYWQKNDKRIVKRIVKRINTLIKDVVRSPYEGIGKPEELRHVLAGYYSRRIDNEHRFVYKVTNDSVLIAQLRHHY